MSRRIAQKDVASIFGIEIDKRPIVESDTDRYVRKARRATSGAFGRVVGAVSDLSPTAKISIALGATFGAGYIVGNIIGGKKAPEAASPSAAPPPPAPSAETVRSGATLTVKTPKGQNGTLRAAPGLGSAVLAYLPSGTVVKVLDTSMSGDKPSKRWYQVQPPTGAPGWMHGDILS